MVSSLINCVIIGLAKRPALPDGIGSLHLELGLLTSIIQSDGLGSFRL